MKINQPLAFPIFQRATLKNTVRPGYEAGILCLGCGGTSVIALRIGELYKVNQPKMWWKAFLDNLQCEVEEAERLCGDSLVSGTER